MHYTKIYNMQYKKIAVQKNFIEQNNKVNNSTIIYLDNSTIIYFILRAFGARIKKGPFCNLARILQYKTTMLNRAQYQ